MDSLAEIPQCPVCGFESIYTDGYSPCSISCALARTARTHLPCHLSRSDAMTLVREEAKCRGLPQSPDIRDVVPRTYAYIRVGASVSKLWEIDRLLLQAGINVEYMWEYRSSPSRIYRVAQQLLRMLPEEIQDYRLCPLTPVLLYKLAGGSPYWHFLSSR